MKIQLMMDCGWTLYLGVKVYILRVRRYHLETIYLNRHVEKDQETHWYINIFYFIIHIRYILYNASMTHPGF